MSFELPKLPYELDALEPHISKRTLEYHYGKHHQGYVNNLNKLIGGSGFENSSLEEIIKKGEGGLFNNAAQIWNHTFYFFQFAKERCDEPRDALMDALVKKFGSFDAFKDSFTKAAATLFGSGWAWLIKTKDGTLEIVQTSNAGNPLRDGDNPVLTCDVWEHAYYLDKQNARPAYIADFWEIIDWHVISDRFLS
jgi:Fe-Mn family superoxide dismutase